MNFNGIKTRFARHAGTVRKLLSHQRHVFFIHRALQNIAVEQAGQVQAARGADGAMGQKNTGDEGTAMGELQGDFAAFGVHCIGNGFEVRQDLGAQPQLIGQGAADFGHRRVGHGGQGDAAGGQVAMMFEQGLGRKALAVHIFVGTGFDKAVAKGDGPYAKATERARIGAGRRLSHWRFHCYCPAQASMGLQSRACAIWTNRRKVSRHPGGGGRRARRS